MILYKNHLQYRYQFLILLSPTAHSLSGGTAPEQRQHRGKSRATSARTSAGRNVPGNTGSQVKPLVNIPLFRSYGVTPTLPLLILLLSILLSSHQPSDEVRNLSNHSVNSYQLHFLHFGLKRLKFCIFNSLMINMIEFNAIFLNFMKITKSRMCSTKTSTHKTSIWQGLTLCNEYPDSNIIGGSKSRKNIFGRNISSSCKTKMKCNCKDSIITEITSNLPKGKLF